MLQRLRILFIGNSDTESLSEYLKALVSDPGFELEIGSWTRFSWTLKDHWLAANTAGNHLNRLLETGRWDFVVLQDQSQIPSFSSFKSREFFDSKAAAVAFAERISRAGTKVRFLVTPGYREGDASIRMPSYMLMQRNIITGYEAYRDAAMIGNAHDVELIYAGKAWARVYDMGHESDGPQATVPFEALYTEGGQKGDPDAGTHPSELGVYLTACTVYASLFDKSPVGLKWAPTSLSAVQRLMLQKVAQAVPMMVPPSTPPLRPPLGKPRPPPSVSLMQSPPPLPSVSLTPLQQPAPLLMAKEQEEALLIAVRMPLLAPVALATSAQYEPTSPSQLLQDRSHASAAVVDKPSSLLPSTHSLKEDQILVASPSPSPTFPSTPQLHMDGFLAVPLLVVMALVCVFRSRSRNVHTKQSVDWSVPGVGKAKGQGYTVACNADDGIDSLTPRGEKGINHFGYDEAITVI